MSRRAGIGRWVAMLVLGLVCVPTAGCTLAEGDTGGIVVLTENEEGIALEAVEDVNPGPRAAAHCRTFGRKAVLRGWKPVETVGEGGSGFAYFFKCVNE